MSKQERKCPLCGEYALLPIHLEKKHSKTDI